MLRYVGVSGWILLEDATLIVEMAIRMGRVPPPQEWIDELRKDQEIATLEGLI